jgi:membrane protein YqaA with SNARE-associated domain
MFRGLYTKIMAMAHHPRAVWWLAAVSFAESSFFPVPPDILLLPMGIAQPRRVWWYALVCTAASVAGGLFGYWIGVAFYDTLGTRIIAWYGLQDAFRNIQEKFTLYAFWVIAFKGLTPVPYKLVTIGSGAFSVPMATFLSASVITRGARFFLLSSLTWRFGSTIHTLLERHMTAFVGLTACVLVGGILMLRFF